MSILLRHRLPARFRGRGSPWSAVVGLVVIAALTVTVASGAEAQLASGVIGGGGVTASSDGVHLLSASAGQALAAAAATGGQSLLGGFWPAVRAAGPSAGAVTRVLLPEAVRALGAQWRLTAGPDTDWHDSDETVSGVPLAGNPYTVTFRAVAGWDSPPDQTLIVVAGETVAAEGFYVPQRYTLAYLSGPNGRLTGTTPQTVDYGGGGTAVAAVANTGYHFAGWSDGSTANPRRDTGVIADLTVTATFEINVYTITFLADVGGAVTGDPVQSVPHGGSTTPVTALPPYAFVFEQWSDGHTDNPRVLTDVSASQTLTARFRDARPVAPQGPFLAVVRPAEVGSQGLLWDLTGAYVLPVGGGTLAMDLVHDTRGRVIGTATYTSTLAPAVSMPVRGSVRGSGGAVSVTLTMAGSDPTHAAAVALALALSLDAGTRQLGGTISGTVGSTGAPSAVGANVALAIPAPMDGTWALQLHLTPADRAVNGVARLRLSNGTEFDYVGNGRSVGQGVTFEFSGAPADPEARGLDLNATVAPLEGGWAALRGLRLRGYGQVLVW